MSSLSPDAWPWSRARDDGAPRRDDSSLVFLHPGFGHCSAHHGELFQGQIEDGDGRLRRCLVSLPCYGLYASACFMPDRTRVVRVEPPDRVRARRVVEIALAHLGAGELGGTLLLTGNITGGKGYGSSTADCVAAARATANALDRELLPQQLADIVVSAEVASDNVMFQHAVLFAQREAVVLEDYGRVFPDLDVLGIDTNPEGFVDTLAYTPAQYDARQIQQFHVLATALRRALHTNDARLLGAVATGSATINEVFLPKTGFAEMRRLVQRIGALGVAVAHSGTVASVLLDPHDPKLEQRVASLLAGLNALGVSRVLRFRTSCERPRVTCLNLASPGAPRSVAWPLPIDMPVVGVGRSL